MDGEYRKVIKEFYAIYRPLQKKSNLQMRGKFDHKGGLLEIWECEGYSKKYCICRIKEEDAVGCYKKAIAMLQMYGSRNEEKAG